MSPYAEDAERDAERAEWNAALASGDEERIARARETLLNNVHRRVMGRDITH